jgi:hypothetical protein
MPFLPETLASIALQTYRNWRVLVWDNGSTDGTVEELASWIPSRLPGRVIAHQPEALGVARARLIEQSTTEFCAWIDSDDVSAPNRLERQVQFLIEHPEVAAVGSQLMVVDEAGDLQGPFGRFALGDDDIVSDMLDGPGLAQPATLFRRSAVLSVGNYRDVGPVNVEDYDLWLRLAAHYKLGNIDEPLLYYRIHDRSSTVIADKAGVLRAAAKARFVAHAPALFGITKQEAQWLVDQQYRCAILALLRIARHLKARSGRPVRSTLRSPYFLSAARTFPAPSDVVSRAALALLRKGARSRYSSPSPYIR